MGTALVTGASSGLGTEYARLFAAVEKARKQSVTRDVIERAIKKGAGIGDEKMTLEHVVFEGYAPHKVPVIVEVMTPPEEPRQPSLSSMRKADGSMVSKPLEDLWPFLPREEFLSNMIISPIEE